MGADQKRGEAEQDRHGKRCSSTTAEGDTGHDHRGDQRDVPDADENPEVAKEDVLGEVLSQVLACGLIECRFVQVGNESAHADPLQRLEGSVEDHERNQRDPADPCRRSLEIADEHIYGSGKQR